MPAFIRPAGKARTIDQQDVALEFPLPDVSAYSEEHIKNAIAQAIKHLQHAIQFGHSGTTLTGALIVPCDEEKEEVTTVYALNCGDSTTQLRDGNFNVLHKTPTHDPSNSDEIDRIMAEDTEGITFYPSNNQAKEQYSLTPKDTFGSLRLGTVNMTRAAFGDRHNLKTTPLIDEPTIDVWRVPHNTPTFLFAYSDGIESPISLKITKTVNIKTDENGASHLYIAPLEAAEDKAEDECEITQAHYPTLNPKKFNGMLLGALEQSGLNPAHLHHDVMQHACKAVCDAAAKEKVTDDCAVLISSLKLDHPALCLVLDGHGEHGHLVARFVKYWLPILLVQSLKQEALDNPPIIDEEHTDCYLANLPDHLRARAIRLLENLAKNPEFKHVRYKFEITLADLSFAEPGSEEYQDALKHFNDCWPDIMHYAKRPILFVESSLCWLPPLITLLGTLVYHHNRPKFDRNTLNSIEVILFACVLAALPFLIPHTLSAYADKFRSLFLEPCGYCKKHQDEQIPGTTILDSDRRKTPACLPKTKKIIATVLLATTSSCLLTLLGHFDQDTMEVFSIVDSIAVTALLGYGLSALWSQAVTCRDHRDTMRLENELQAFSRAAQGGRTLFGGIKIEMARREKDAAEKPKTPLLQAAYA